MLLDSAGDYLPARVNSLSPAALYREYTDNLVWSLFLTSTAIHAILLITSPL
jgi:hypothetical protein